MEIETIKNHSNNLLDTYCRNWVWRSTELLLSMEQDSATIAKKLGVSIECVLEALNGLVSLGMATKDLQGYKRVEGQHNYGPKDLTRDDLLNIHTTLSMQISSKLTSNDKFTTCFHLADKTLIDEYSAKFVALYKEMIDEGFKRGCKEVYASPIGFAKMHNGEN